MYNPYGYDSYYSNPYQNPYQQRARAAALICPLHHAKHTGLFLH